MKKSSIQFLVLLILFIPATLVSSQENFFKHEINTILFRQNDLFRLGDLKRWIAEKDRDGWYPFYSLFLNSHLNFGVTRRWSPKSLDLGVSYLFNSLFF